MSISCFVLTLSSNKRLLFMITKTNIKPLLDHIEEEILQTAMNLSLQPAQNITMRDESMDRPYWVSWQ